MFKPLKIKYFMLFLLLSSFFILAIKSEPLSKTNNDNTLSVDVVSLIKQNINITNEYVGYITPIKSLEVMANVSGYIDQIFVNGGDSVSKGDNLVLLDQRQYKADFESAKASLKMAEAEYTNTKNYYQRVMKTEKNVISASDIDNAKASFLSSEAKLKQANADLEKAKILLDYTVLQSSIDGIVGNIALTEGNFVNAGQSKLFEIIQTSPIRIEFAISDKEFLTFFTGSIKDFENIELKIKLADNSLYNNKGKFAYIDNKVNKQTNSLAVFADFENPDNRLLANSYVSVLLIKNLRNVFLINQKYTKLSDKGIFVYIVKNNKVRQEKLNVVGYYNDAYVVDNNFAKNEFLVVDNIENIEANTKLKIKITDDNPEIM